MKLAFRLAAAAAAFAPAFALAARIAGVELPALPDPRPVMDTHWGVQVEDPYRFLENTGDPEVQKYMRAQADAAHAILQKIPGRERVLARIREIDAASSAQVGEIRRDARGGIFHLKRDPDANQYKLYHRERDDGPDRLLVDPEAVSKARGTPYAISEFSPSRDGKRLAYQISGGGSEIGSLHVIDVATLEEVTPSIDRIRYGGVSWLADGSGFFYLRLAEGYEKRPRAERFMDMHAHLRRLDTPGKDSPVFGSGLHPEVTIERSAAGGVVEVPGAPLFAALVYHGVSPHRSLYVTERAALLEGKPRWRKVFDQGAKIHEASAGGGFVYLRSSDGASRYKVLRMAAAEPDLARAETLVPAGEEVIVASAAAKDALYLTRRDGAVKRLWRIPHAKGAIPERVAMPLEGNIDLKNADPYLDGVVLALGSWTRATAFYRLGAEAPRPVPLPLAEPGKFDAPAGLIAREVKVKSHDGVEVPVSIISRSDVKLDGRNPTMLYGYAAYGIVEEPTWNPRSLVFLEQGGVIAMAHARGGGIYGDDWRRAGWKTTKPNTWKDGIAVAQWLVDNRYTTASRLSIYGGSAGGIFVGRAITERPDLFSAAVIGVGNTDSIRSETRANGAGNIPEYGTVKIEQEFHALRAMSPYANIVPGTRYPAVLLEHGVNDSRVDVWMTLKFGTRLAAASTGGKPVLMRLEYDAGHGPGTTREQLVQRLADRWSFILWQAGVPEFEPNKQGPSPSK